MNNLVIRSISGTVYVALNVAFTMLPVLQPFFRLLMMVFTGLCLYEYFSMMLNAYTLQRKAYLVVGGSIAFWLITAFWQDIDAWKNVLFLFGLILIHLSLSFVLARITIEDLMKELFGVFVIVFGMACVVGIGQFTLYKAMPFFQHSTLYFNGAMILIMFILVWANDTMGYAVGRAIGKTQIVPKISPKKTLEGYIGGLIGVLLALAAIKQWWMPDITWKSVLLVSVVAAISSSLGDLLESGLKRHADVKDSGHLMPGHGGILDRFDGVILAAPVLFIVLIWFHYL